MTHPAYGALHQRRRAILLNQLRRDEVLHHYWTCPRCGLVMRSWQPLDLGHTRPSDKAQGLPGDRLEHAGCNRQAKDGTIPLWSPPGHTPSRDW